MAHLLDGRVSIVNDGGHAIGNAYCRGSNRANAVTRAESGADNWMGATRRELSDALTMSEKVRRILQRVLQIVRCRGQQSVVRANHLFEVGLIRAEPISLSTDRREVRAAGTLDHAP